LSHATTFRANTEDWNFGDIVSMVVDSIQRFCEPAESDVRQAETRIGQFIWGVAGPLLHAPNLKVLRATLQASASPEITERLVELMSGRAAKTALERARRKSAVEALRPRPGECSQRVAEFSSDFVSRASELATLIVANENLAGFRRPPLAEVEPVYAQFVAIFLSLALAARMRGISDETVGVLFEQGNRDIAQLARLFRIKSDKLETRVAARLASEEADAAELRAADRLMLAREVADEEAALALD